MRDLNIPKSGYFIIVFIIILFFWLYILLPFVQPILWSFVLSILIYPAYKLILNRVKSPALSASICCIITIFLIVLPLYFIFRSALKEASSLIGLLRDLKIADISILIRDALGSSDLIPLFKSFIDRLQNSDFNLTHQIYQALEHSIQYITSNVFSFIKNFVWFVINTFIVLITTFFLLVESKNIVSFAKDFSPLDKNETNILLKKIKETVQTTLFGIVFVAIIQGFLAAFAFWLVGISSVVFWGIAMSLLAMIPFLGAPIIWFPAAVILLIKGSIYKGVFLMLWGMFVVGWIDNILRPIIIGTKARLHPLLVFFSVFGAILLLGPIGLFMGPVILATVVTTIEFLRNKAS